MLPLLRDFGLLALGFIGLWGGAELLVKYSSRLAQALGVSPIIIGLTVVSLGTSIPELVVCVIAAFHHDPEIAIGNIVGSNIANLGLILGVGAMLIPLEIKASWSRREVPYMILVTFFFLLFASTDATLTQLEGLIMCGFLLLFISYVAKFTLQEMDEFKELKKGTAPKNIRHDTIAQKWIYFFLSVVGIAILISGSELSLSSGTRLADALGVSHVVIGLTLIALGTSLPELATTIVSALRREGDLAIGNVIGSNIFNLTLIGGITPLIRTMPIEKKLLFTEFPLLFFLTLLIWPMMYFNWNVHRSEGLALISIYTIFIVLTIGG